MILALAVLVKSTKSAMELLANIIQIGESLVLYPSFTSAFFLLLTSGINELLGGFVPYVILLSGHMIFIQAPLSLASLTQTFFFIAIPVGIGTALGSFVIYWIAYLGGKPAIEKFGKHVRLKWESVERVQSKFKGVWYDDLIFLLLRSAPFLPGLPLNVAAGLLRMRALNFLFLTTAGSVIKVMITCVLVGIGAVTVSSF